MSKIIDIKPGDRILISRTDRLGDLILALPLVETLKVRYPECSIEVLASLYASPILENNDRIDKIMRVQNEQLWTNKLYKKDLLHRFKMADYRAVIALYPEKHVSQLFYKAGIPIRIGTGRRFHSAYFTNRLMHTRKSNSKHEYEYNLDFLEFFRNGETVAAPRVYPTDKETRNALRILKLAGVESPFVVLHPGSGGSAERWPLERFLQTREELTQAGIQVVLTGSEDERKAIEKISGSSLSPLKTIAGETDLRTLAAVLSLAGVVVANSTGPLHLAAAVGTRVVGLFPSKKVMSPRRWGPVGERHAVLQPSMANCQCPGNECQCMETIGVETVAQKVLKHFGESRLNPHA